MPERESDHTLHAEHMLSMFGGHTFLLKCECGDTRAVVTVFWKEGQVHITAVDDEYTVIINRFGAPDRYKSS